jgi:hypothetical protein
VTATPPHDSAANSDAADLRRMAPIYAAVILVEAVTLAALWWFQTAFGR